MNVPLSAGPLRNDVRRKYAVVVRRTSFAASERREIGGPAELIHMHPRGVLAVSVNETAIGSVGGVRPLAPRAARTGPDQPRW